jgi:hypothetical protein
LAPTLRDDARETWQGSHVGQFVQGQEQGGALVVTVVGGVHHFLNEAHHERNGDGLVTTWRDNVQLMRSSKELFNVEWRLTR